MTWDLVTVTKWTLGQGPTLHTNTDSHRWSRDKPYPPHPMIVTGNIVGSPVVRTSTKKSYCNLKTEKCAKKLVSLIMVK